jgi:prevent-host-death family protein
MTMVMLMLHKEATPMRTMPAGEFKAKCLAVMDEVQATGLPVLITKRGKPVARLAPIEVQTQTESPEAIFGCLRGFLAKPGQTIGPEESFIPREEWEQMEEGWSQSWPE